jgi:hypothetical protein
MKRTLTICLAAALSSVVAVFSAATALAADDGPRNVVLIGWDGAQRAHVHECLARGELPTLKKLGEEGGLVDIDVVNGATDTKAGWSQILTGYNPEVTGVYSNGKYHDVPKGLSVFERLEEHFGADKFVTVAVIGKSAHCGEIKPPSKVRVDANAPLGGLSPAGGDQPAGKKGAKKAAAGKQPGAGKQSTGSIVEENGVKYRVFGGSPYYTMHKSCDVWEYGLVQDEKVGSRALELLDKYKDKQFFFFVHFAEVDHSGHKAGENSKEYNDALISGDTWTGKIIEKLKQLGLYDKTTVYVTADHGFNEGATNHSYAPYVFLGTNDARVKRAGMRQDITPTVLERFGLELGKYEPKLDGESLACPAVKPVLKAPEAKGGAAAAGRKKKAA